MGIKFEKVDHIYKGIKKQDDVFAIKNINLEISDDNEFICVVGQTGSGKSTLISHLNALVLPSKGLIDIYGNIITPKKRKNPKLKPIRKKVGFVFQFPEYQLFEETVLKDIKFAPKNFGLKEAEAIEVAKATAKLVGIDDSLLSKSPFNLSGGQMRKVAIAGILSYNPDLLVLDEPTRGLDPEGAKDVMELFNKINKEMNKTIVMITHDMDLVYKYATRVVVMDKGEIVYDGDKKTLFLGNSYDDFHLEKPTVIKTIDELNKQASLNLSYDLYDYEDLYNELRRVVK